MPMVNESYSSPLETVKVGRNDTHGKSLSTKSYRRANKSQYGYRSGPLSLAEERSIEESASTWATARTRIDALEQGYDYVQKDSRVFMVNHRDYTESRATPATFTSTVGYQGPTYPDWKFQGAVLPTGADLSVLPGWQSPESFSSKAGGMIRRIEPTKQEVNLVRFIGEQREAPMLFRASQWRPRNPKEMAGAYLGYVFGVMPTVSDLSAIADTAIRWDAVLRRYIRQERVKLRRSASIPLYSVSGRGTLPRVHGLDQVVDLGPVKCTTHHLLPGNADAFSDVVMVEGGWSYTASRTLKAFATWEYFIPKPEGLGGRLDYYSRMASRVAGGGLSYSTMYDLTPWTWLVGWFIDVGGLIRYAENVGDNQVVQSRAGYSIWEELTWNMNITGMYRSVSPTLVGAWPTRYQKITPSKASYRHRRHARRPGSPYSMAPQWDLSQKQWSILAALGVSKRGDGGNISFR